MSFWTAIVLIVLIGAIASVLEGRKKTAGRKADDEGNALQSQADKQQIAELKERIAVLERIATDNRQSVELSEEIEKLREADGAR